MAKSKIGDLASAVHTASEAPVETRRTRARSRPQSPTTGRPRSTPIPSGAPTRRTAKPLQEALDRPAYPSREGLRGIVCYVEPEVWAALRHHTIDELSTVQQVAYTALRDYMKKHKIEIVDRGD